mgnify:FL=1
MADDIFFYNLKFEMLHILPAYADGEGCSSITATPDLVDNGGFEIVLKCEELKDKLTANRDGVIVIWRDFQGYMTSFRITDSEVHLFGVSLNGLLHRIVIPSLTESNRNVESAARSAISANASWITLGESASISVNKTYGTDTYMCADEFLKQLFDGTNCGFKLRADIKSKKYIFECIKPLNNALMLSKNNLNAYDFVHEYSNQNVAFGGWYKKEQSSGDGVWTYIKLDGNGTGIDKIDTVLSSTTDADAKNELKELAAQYTVTAATKDVYHGIDYSLGDILRVQDGDVTTKKQVTGIEMWQEQEYGEKPVLSDYEEGSQ